MVDKELIVEMIQIGAASDVVLSTQGVSKCCRLAGTWVVLLHVAGFRCRFGSVAFGW